MSKKNVRQLAQMRVCEWGSRPARVQGTFQAKVQEQKHRGKGHRERKLGPSNYYILYYTLSIINDSQINTAITQLNTNNSIL